MPRFQKGQSGNPAGRKPGAFKRPPKPPEQPVDEDVKADVKADMQWLEEHYPERWSIPPKENAAANKVKYDGQKQRS